MSTSNGLGLIDVKNAAKGIARSLLMRVGNAIPAISNEANEKVKKFFNFTPISYSITRWDLTDIEKAIHQSDGGNIQLAAQLCDAIKRDGIADGVLSTRTDGLVRLPLRWNSGNQTLIDIWNGKEKTKGIFSQKIPTAELVKILADGILLGVGLGQMVPVEKTDTNSSNKYVDSVLQRIDPSFIQFDLNTNKIYYNAIGGRVEITPGDGTWVLYTPGGINTPWKSGKWRSLARPFIVKEHAFYNRQNYSAKFANPARVAYSPNTSTQRQRDGMLENMIQWGQNPSFVLPENWEIKLLESAGKGFEIFQNQIDNADREIMVSLTGQIVTTMGTTGFSNGSIHQAIRQDLIQASAESLAECINTQIIIPWVNFYFAELLSASPEFYWDTTPPTDLAAEADTLTKVGQAVVGVNQAVAPYNKELDLEELEKQFNLKLKTKTVAVVPTTPIVPTTTVASVKKTTRKRKTANEKQKTIS